MDTTNDDATIQTRKILFVTNSEDGQANTILAMALEAVTRPHIEVHVASFLALKRRVERLSSKLNFHPLDGECMFDMMAAQGVLEENLSHPPVTKSFELCGRRVLLVMVTWDWERGLSFLLQMWVATDARRFFI